MARRPPPGVTKKTLIDTYHEGGWVMHILLIFSIGMVWLIIDIWLRTNSKKMTPEEDLAIVREAFLAGDYVGAYQAMKASFSPFAEVMRAGLGSVGYGKEATEEAIYATVEKISSTLQTRINYLSVIGVCAPMIGLLGTVGGMKGAFGSLGTTGLSGGVGELGRPHRRGARRHRHRTSGRHSGVHGLLFPAQQTPRCRASPARVRRASFPQRAVRLPEGRGRRPGRNLRRPAELGPGSRGLNLTGRFQNNPLIN